MEWSPTSAARAYFHSLRLHGGGDRRLPPPSNNTKTKELAHTEFISALAAGMIAKLLVEVASYASPTTIALATAALHIGGRLVCTLPEPVLDESKKGSWYQPAEIAGHQSQKIGGHDQ
ncbi:hypothetical protein MLD38_039052 [Melastoma candidum]|uniref:Uncharacterized protein n=1 Tax=Melastoma candidum TaxID=119954 RepID=A0ACB9L368_9MYRT|nr:hypothetical protein MLD38_039052 [Melastoma candidum]